MQNYFLKIKYNGQNYYGWNMQPSRETIVSKLTKALKNFYKGKIEFQGSGRTDKGVHAFEQTATIKLDLKIKINILKKLMNQNLPKDIEVISVSKVSNDFHARYSAKNKTYQYRIKTESSDRVWDNNYYWYINEKLNISKMQKAAKLFCKTTDFKSFATITKKDQIVTKKTINSITIKKEGIKILIQVNGNGFLRHMVRKIVATLVQVGLGNIDENFIEKALKSHDPSAIPYKAPSCGLYLKKVYYK